MRDIPLSASTALRPLEISCWGSVRRETRLQTCYCAATLNTTINSSNLLCCSNIWLRSVNPIAGMWLARQKSRYALFLTKGQIHLHLKSLQFYFYMFPISLRHLRRQWKCDLTPCVVCKCTLYAFSVGQSFTRTFFHNLLRWTRFFGQPSITSLYSMLLCSLYQNSSCSWWKYWRITKLLKIMYPFEIGVFFINYILPWYRGRKLCLLYEHFEMLEARTSHIVDIEPCVPTDRSKEK